MAGKPGTLKFCSFYPTSSALDYSTTAPLFLFTVKKFIIILLAMKNFYSWLKQSKSLTTKSQKMEWLTNMREELNDQERENGDGFSTT